MNAEELQAVLDCIVTAKHHEDPDRIVLECNHCSGITYTDDLYGEDFGGIASSLLNHLWQRHPEKIEPRFDPVTEEEVREVFGLSPIDR